ncbi:unnamed protein product, partial [Nesidiocoris tenuis]
MGGAPAAAAGVRNSTTGLVFSSNRSAGVHVLSSYPTLTRPRKATADHGPESESEETGTERPLARIRRFSSERAQKFDADLRPDDNHMSRGTTCPGLACPTIERVPPVYDTFSCLILETVNFCSRSSKCRQK